MRATRAAGLVLGFALVDAQCLNYLTPRLPRQSAQRSYAVSPKLFERVMVLLASWNILNDIESLETPILLAHGRYDYAVPCTLWNGVVEKIPNATLRMFEHSGHQVFFEEPAKFAEVVLGWLSTSDTR